MNKSLNLFNITTTDTGGKDSHYCPTIHSYQYENGKALATYTRGNTGTFTISNILTVKILK